MKRKDRIKLDFTRNWKLPGKERLSNWLKPSEGLKSTLKNGITWLSNEDIAIFTTADNYIEWSLLSTGTYEDEINKLIRISLKPGNNALDIGANIGLQSIRMGQSVGNAGHVYSFEPLNYLQSKFKKNIALNRLENVTLFPFALSNQAGEIACSINENNWNQGTFSLGDKSNGDKTQQILIKVADELPEIKELSRLDLIKIDVEGFEFQVLKGVVATLRKHKPRIIFEYDSNYWAANGQQINDCYNFLKGLHYELYQVTSVGCEPIINVENIQGGNLFCI
ncbi:MAG TPA: FkbM family methyltransferase [Mucilaginibacter sp.]|jgi:FkbM family methyltransferase